MKKWIRILPAPPAWRLFAALALFALSPLACAWAQEPEAAADSLPAQAIPLERIPIASGETGLLLLREAESLPSAGQIARESARNDSILTIIDSLLALEREVDLEELDTRFLNNKKSLWSGFGQQLERQKTGLTQIVGEARGCQNPDR